jgi:hypothetical protein
MKHKFTRITNHSQPHGSQARMHEHEQKYHNNRISKTMPPHSHPRQPLGCAGQGRRRPPGCASQGHHRAGCRPHAGRPTRRPRTCKRRETEVRRWDEKERCMRRV